MKIIFSTKNNILEHIIHVLEDNLILVYLFLPTANFKRAKRPTIDIKALGIFYN